MDNKNMRIIYGKEMTACESHFGIIEYQNGRFIETKSLDITGVGSDHYIPDYNGLVTVYNYKVNGESKKMLYKKGEEELSEEEIQDNFPEFQFIKKFRSKG